MAGVLEFLRRNPLVLLLGGAAAIAGVVWWAFFRTPIPTQMVREARTVEELVNTPLGGPVELLQTPEVHLTLGRSECEDLLIRYNGASRNYPALASRYRAEAKALGCGWAQ